MEESKINVSQSSLIEEEVEVVLSAQQMIQQKVISGITSPTTVWFASLYFSVLLSMISFNLFRVGFNIEGLTGGPSYYSRLFLYYGLNEGGYYDSPYLHGLSAWLFAPFIAVWLGVVLYFMTMGGYAFNGTTFSDPTGAFFFAFFSENVYGFEHNFFGEKGNLFYIGIIWIPIILSCIITIYYKNWVKRETSIVTRFIVSVFISFWVGIEMAKMTDASIVLNWEGFSESMFEDRHFNFFVQYSGEYHPSNLATVIFLYSIVVLIIYSLLDNIGNFIAYSRLQYKVITRRRAMFLERRKQGILNLPWEVDDETQKVQSDKSQPMEVNQS